MSLVFRCVGVAAALLGTVFVFAVSSQAQERKAMSVDVKPFGKTADGAAVEIYTLKNAAGVEVRADRVEALRALFCEAALSSGLYQSHIYDARLLLVRQASSPRPAKTRSPQE